MFIVREWRATTSDKMKIGKVMLRSEKNSKICFLLHKLLPTNLNLNLTLRARCRKMCLMSKSRWELNLKRKIKPLIKQGKMNLSNSFSDLTSSRIHHSLSRLKIHLFRCHSLQLRASTHSVIACVQTTFHTCLSISPVQRVNFLPKLWWWKTHSRVPIKKRKLSHLLCVCPPPSRTRNS